MLLQLCHLRCDLGDGADCDDDLDDHQKIMINTKIMGCDLIDLITTSMSKDTDLNI